MAEMNRWDIRHVYLYLVCFATLMMVIIGSVQLMNGLVDVLYPNTYLGPKAPPYTAMQQKDSNITQEEINRQTEEEQQRQEASMNRSKVINIVNSLALIGISLPIYFYHWRKIQHGERKID